MIDQGILDLNLMEYGSLLIPIDSNIIHTVFSHDITSYFWSSPFSCAIFPSSLVIVALGSSVPIKIAMFPALFLPLIDDGPLVELESLVVSTFSPFGSLYRLTICVCVCEREREAQNKTKLFCRSVCVCVCVCVCVYLRNEDKSKKHSCCSHNTNTKQCITGIDKLLKSK